MRSGLQPHRLNAWRDRYPTFFSVDFAFGAAATIATLGAALTRADIRKPGVTLLLVGAGVGAAMLTVVLTALAILVAFLGRAYVKLLRESVSIPTTMRPYKTVATVSGAATIVALGCALAYPALRSGAQALALALAAGALTWSVVGTVGIVRITAWHGAMRSRMGEIPEAARDALEERRKNSA